MLIPILQVLQKLMKAIIILVHTFTGKSFSVTPELTGLEGDDLRNIFRPVGLNQLLEKKDTIGAEMGNNTLESIAIKG